MSTWNSPWLSGRFSLGAWRGSPWQTGRGWNPRYLFLAGQQGAWYDPSDLSTLFQDSAGTAPVTADGDPVGLMLDKSGNGNHATQTTSASRPVYRTDGTLHWLEADGVDDFMVTASLSASLFTAGVFLSASAESATDEVFSGLLSLQDTVDDLSRVLLAVDTRSGSPIRHSNYAADGTNSWVDLTAKFDPNVTAVFTANSDGSQMEGFLDSVLQETAESSSTFVNPLRVEVLRQQVGGFYLQGKSFGMIVLNRELSPSEREGTENYLAQKAGVTL